MENQATATADRSQADEVWARIRERYKTLEEKGETGSFEAEAFLLREGLKRFITNTASRYPIEDFEGMGATGLVFRAIDLRLNTRRALKIARPVQGREVVIEQLLVAEIGMLSRVA